MQIVRRAVVEDALGIHRAHMRSVLGVCSKDHSVDEIRGWSARPFNEEQRVNAILNHYVWVVDCDGVIEGYGQLQVYQRDDSVLAHVHGLYLTDVALGQGHGRAIFSQMLEVAKQADVNRIGLESTLTAHDFYKKLGFSDSGPMQVVTIGGSEVRCYPMSIELK